MARQQHTRENPGRKFHKRDGYWQVFWCENGKTIMKQEHRWVWEQAHGPIPEGFVIHHIDHDKTNNDLSNLRCMTIREHNQHHRAAEGMQAHDSAEAYHAAELERKRKWNEANREAKKEYMREYRAARKKLA